MILIVMHLCMSALLRAGIFHIATTKCIHVHGMKRLVGIKILSIHNFLFTSVCVPYFQTMRDTDYNV